MYSKMLQFKRQGNTKMEMFFCKFEGIRRADELCITPRTLTCSSNISEIPEREVFQHWSALRKSLAIDKYQMVWNYVTLEKLFTISLTESRENSSNSSWAIVVIFSKMYCKIFLWIKETESVTAELQVSCAVREQWRFLDNWAFPFYVLRLIFSSLKKKKDSLCTNTCKMYCKCSVFINRLNHNTFTVPPWLQWPWLSV